jgi:DNA-binding IclR family transcriptional regulator
MSTSADRAFDLLDEIASRSAPAGLIELATAAGLDKSTASRLLAVLCGRGLVARDPDTRRYEPGPALLLLATQVLDNSPLRSTAHNHLQRLRDTSGETVTLQLRVGLQRVCVDGADSSQPVRRVAHIGEVNPLYVGVTGKVITAFLPPEQVSAVLADGLATGRDMSRLPSELELIRRRGYHAGIGDKSEGVAGISAPVLTSRGVIAGLTVSGPHDRWTMRRMAEFAPTLLAAARDVSAALGGR